LNAQMVLRDPALIERMRVFTPHSIPQLLDA
jgi:hypothetical protein